MRRNDATGKEFGEIITFTINHAVNERLEKVKPRYRCLRGLFHFQTLKMLETTVPIVQLFDDEASKERVRLVNLLHLDTVDALNNHDSAHMECGSIIGSIKLCIEIRHLQSRSRPHMMLESSRQMQLDVEMEEHL